MLTKDLLKFTLRSGRVYPKQIKATESHLNLAADVLSCFEGHVGETSETLQEALSDILPYGPPIGKAMAKLVEDRCDFTEPTSLQHSRWDLLRTASELRSQITDLKAYREAVGQALATPPELLSEQIYGDLPALRCLAKVPAMTAQQLVERYNCAQVQGILLRAQDLEMTFTKPEIGQLRWFFRMMKFQGLFCELLEAPNKQTWRLSLSGPLALFQGAQAYGLRLAIFFPYLLHMPQWKLQATVSLKGKLVQLELDASSKLQSHYQARYGYIPEAFNAFSHGFKDSSWQVEPGSDWCLLGGRYCFPDFEIHSGDKRFYLELFHRWHQHQAKQRLRALLQEAEPQLMLGLCRGLKSDKELNGLVEEAQNTGRKVFWFHNLPTPRAVLAQLK